MAVQPLFVNVVTNTTAPVKVGSAVSPVWILAQGSFGGGTVKLQVSADGTNWYDVPASSLTASGFLSGLTLIPGFQYQIVLTGATAPALSAWVAGP